MQLRAISKFGTLSATATTNWELRIIIENERGIWSLPITVVANRVLKERPDAGPNSNFYLRPAALVYAKSDKRAVVSGPTGKTAQSAGVSDRP